MKKLLVAASLLLATVATPAFAATPFYAGLSVGDGVTLMGGYQIDKTLSAELEYTSYSSRSSYSCGFTNCGNYANASSLGGFGVAKFPLNLKGAAGLSVFGRVGLVRTQVSASGPGWYYSESRFDIAFGGGAQYDFNQTFSGRLGIDFNNAYSNNLYIGGLVRF